MPTPERRPATDAEARALASGVRMRILRLCLDRALTNKEIATRLDADPATILHHVRTLVATGFLVAEEPRRGNRGAREVPYRATGKSWNLDTSAHPVTGSGQALLDAFLDEIRHVDVDMADQHLGFSRLGLRLNQEELVELTERLDDVLREFAARPANMADDARPISVFLAVHPDVTRP
jgi:DNA-binding transcriptional ArsR family regulator